MRVNGVLDRQLFWGGRIQKSNVFVESVVRACLMNKQISKNYIDT